MKPLTLVIIVDIFDVSGMDFVRAFPNSFRYEYILVCMNYMSKWVETIPTRTNAFK